MGNDAMRALLLTHEPSTAASFSAVCGELGIEAHSNPPAGEVCRCLDEQRYSAVILDFENPEAAEKYVPALHESRLNKYSVLIGVATHARSLERALQCRAHFVLKRPVQEIEVRRTLRAAYDFMLVDRRRDLRCPKILPVRLRLLQGGASFECSTVNISANGVALYSSTRLKPAEAVDLEIVLPDGFVVSATGLVVWDDGAGKSGLHFRCRTPEIRQKLDAWLGTQSDPPRKLEMPLREFSPMIGPGAGAAVPAEKMSR